MKILIPIVIIAVLLGIWGVNGVNGLVRQDEDVNAAWDRYRININAAWI